MARCYHMPVFMKAESIAIIYNLDKIEEITSETFINVLNSFSQQSKTVYFLLIFFFFESHEMVRSNLTQLQLHMTLSSSRLKLEITCNVPKETTRTKHDLSCYQVPYSTIL